MNRRTWLFPAGALAVCLALAGLLSPFASSSPDGLERVAKDKGFIEKSEGDPVWKWTPLRDYVIPGIANRRMATASAGVIGTVIVFGCTYGIARALKRKRAHRSEK